MYLDLSVSPAGKNKQTFQRMCSDLCIFKSTSYAKLWIKHIGFAMWSNFVHICTSKGYNGEILTQLLMKFLINQSLEHILQCSVTKTDSVLLGQSVDICIATKLQTQQHPACCCRPQVLNYCNDLAQLTHSLFLTQRQFTNQSVHSLVDIPRSYHVFGGLLNV